LFLELALALLGLGDLPSVVLENSLVAPTYGYEYGPAR
jgi:hypothetical protein